MSFSIDSPTDTNRVSRRLDWLLPSWLEDSSAYDQTMDEDMESVYYTIIVNLIIFFACVFFFSWYRRINTKIYYPKVDLMPGKTPPPIPHDTYFGWVRDLYYIDDSALIAKGGYDILFFIRFYRLSFNIFAVFAVYAWLVILPINGTADNGGDANSFQVWSMTNIPQGSERCWAHLIGICLLTAVTIYFLEKEFVVYAKYRHMYLRQRHAHLRTVLVQGIPQRLRSTVTLATYFEAMYPNAVLSVHCGQNLAYLDRLVEQRVQVVTHLERALYIEHNTHVRRTIAVENYAQEVDAIRYYTKLLESLNDEIEREQAIARDLALNVERSSGEQNPYDIIEGFLRVTEMGSVKKMLKAKTGKSDKWTNYLRRGLSTDNQKYNLTHTISRDTSKSSLASPSVDQSSTSTTANDNPYNSFQNSGGYGSLETAPLTKTKSNSSANANASSSGNNSNSSGKGRGGGSSSPPMAMSMSRKSPIGNDDSPDFVDDDDVYINNEFVNEEGFYETDEGSELNAESRPLKSGYNPSLQSAKSVIYKMSWSEWIWALWTSSSASECWRVLSSVREAEDTFFMNYEEPPVFLTPPEERKMFLSKAFVTFKNFTAATIARQVIHMQLAGHMAVSEAPQSSDITWINMYTTRTSLFWRRVWVEVAVNLLIVVWVAPVTLVSFLVSEDALRGYFPFIDEWCSKSQMFTSTIELIQPGALVGIMNLLPPILTGLGILEGCISFSSNQFKAFDRYFTFQVINVFLVATIAGSVIDSLEAIYEDPGSTFSLLGNSLPKMGAYFMNFLIMKAFIGLGMEIIRIPAKFSALAKLLFTPNLTPRDRMLTPLFGGIRSLHNPGWFPFAKIYAQDIMLVVVCATYACIAPLIIAAGLCYFAGAAYIYKHQMLYVYEAAFETGGKWWPKMARCFVVALLFAQATMVGMMILKETFLEIYFLGVIFVVTSFYYWHVASIYIPLGDHLPFDMATAMDLDQQIFHDELAGAEEYAQPSLRVPKMSPVVDYDSKTPIIFV